MDTTHVSVYCGYYFQLTQEAEARLWLQGKASSYLCLEHLRGKKVEPSVPLKTEIWPGCYGWAKASCCREEPGTLSTDLLKEEWTYSRKQEKGGRKVEL